MLDSVGTAFFYGLGSVTLSAPIIHPTTLQAQQEETVFLSSSAHRSPGANASGLGSLCVPEPVMWLEGWTTLATPRPRAQGGKTCTFGGQTGVGA